MRFVIYLCPTENAAPIAIAGPDISVNEGSVVTLDGTGSSDAEGDQLTYEWTAPLGIKLSSTTAAKPTFTAPEVKKDSVISISLVVNILFPLDSSTIFMSNAFI